MDWSLSSSWTMARGEHAWLDGINYTYEGLLAFAAMARRLGKKKDSDWGDYLSAKIEAFIANCWKSAPYAQKYSPRPNAPGEVAAGYFECRLPGAGDHSGWSCGGYSYLVREVFVLLGDLKKRGDLGRTMKKFSSEASSLARLILTGTAKPAAIPAAIRAGRFTTTFSIRG